MTEREIRVRIAEAVAKGGARGPEARDAADALLAFVLGDQPKSRQPMT